MATFVLATFGFAQDSSQKIYDLFATDVPSSIQNFYILNVVSVTVDGKERGVLIDPPIYFKIDKDSVFINQKEILISDVKTKDKEYKIDLEGENYYLVLSRGKFGRYSLEIVTIEGDTITLYGDIAYGSEDLIPAIFTK